MQPKEYFNLTIRYLMYLFYISKYFQQYDNILIGKFNPAV